MKKIGLLCLFIFLTGCESAEFYAAKREFYAAEKEWNAAHERGDQAAMWAAFRKEQEAIKKELATCRSCKKTPEIDAMLSR